MYDLKEIEKYTNGKIINGNPKMQIKHYSIAKEKHQIGEFYIPIIFHEINREEFILDSVKAGGVGFLISKNAKNLYGIIEKAKKINQDIGIIEVEDVNQAIYQLGLESRRRNQEKPIIAVTGSVGKTTLCKLLANVLKTQNKVLHDFKNENNNTRCHIAFTLLEFNHYDMAVLELGISQKGVMTQITKLVEPSIAVINSIGSQHLDKLENKETVLAEKLHITDFIKDKKILFVNTDNNYLQDIEKTNTYEVRKYSTKEAYDIQETNGKLSFKTSIYEKGTEFNLNLYGRHHIANIILAIKIGEIYQISYENIVKAISEFQPVDGRLKVLKSNKSNILLIDDAYNFSIEAIQLGLETASKIKSKRKIAIIGEMTDLGEQSVKIHQELGKYLKQLNFDTIYTVEGKYTQYFEGDFIKRFENIEEIIQALDKNLKDGDLVYVKGANSQHFNKIVEFIKTSQNCE
ncbi:MAG: UDP-N-acetylmuramoyl-tripeptide--D-alanyl-D-alanine ligase [Clostridia bacterium]|nr:UDP-N-acetylmuramoyl-tripeptide--D-alanyl-D-alanine ligase [Clostridia bacterium]